MPTISDLFENNRSWAAEIVRRDPTFFQRLTAQQAPSFLWIGCSDSRVPANEIVGLLPGEMFVHRNVANLVVHTDLNCLSALQYAVDVLRVQHVIVTGHYGCGGIAVALTEGRHGLIDNWLGHVQDVAHVHSHELSALAGKAREDRLCELNVAEQVLNAARSTIVRDAWLRGQPLAIHGWVYTLHDGLLHDQYVTVTNDSQVTALAQRLHHRASSTR
ncbi:MAG: carbonate dehydratase [Gemmatimonadetes bacterium]|nr:carbonate dehydratase [Gemmatimonadota bacterium]